MTGFVPFLVAALAALATLLVEHLQQSIASGGGVYVALSLMVAAWLFWHRRGLWLRRVQIDDEPSQLQRERGNPSTTSFMGIIGLASALLAQLIHSPFLGWMTFLFLIGVVAYAEFSAEGVKACLPVLILLAFVKPIPAMLEPWIQFALQSASTSLTMMMLDFLKIFFFTEGNAIGLISQQTLASNLFEGVAWLYPAVFTAIAWSIYFQYHGLRTFLNVCQAIFWVLLWNAFGAAVLLANKEWGGSWMDSAPGVTAWSFIVLALILFFMWSSDQFLSSIFRPKADETATDVSDVSDVASSMSPGWQLRGMDWGVVVGFIAICLLSVRLTSQYGWGWVSPPSQLASLSLPKEWESWKIEEEEPLENRFYDHAPRSLRRWNLANEGKQMTLEVCGPGSTDLPYLYRWRWNGWNLDSDANPATEFDEADGSTFARLVRLPGEACGLIALGADRYGAWMPANPAVGWFNFPSVAWTNLLGAVGINSAKSAFSDVTPPAGHTISLSWKGVKTLDKEKTEELKSVWRKVLPFVRQQFGTPGSR